METVLRAAIDRDIAAMTQLIDVVLDTPAMRASSQSGGCSPVMISSGKPSPVTTGTPS
jgi:hypothetical protein